MINDLLQQYAEKITLMQLAGHQGVWSVAPSDTYEGHQNILLVYPSSKEKLKEILVSCGPPDKINLEQHYTRLDYKHKAITVQLCVPSEFLCNPTTTYLIEDEFESLLTKEDANAFDKNR